MAGRQCASERGQRARRRESETAGLGGREQDLDGAGGPGLPHCVIRKPSKSTGKGRKRKRGIYDPGNTWLSDERSVCATIMA